MFANIPTALTWLRILLIPVFVAVYYLPDAWLGPAAKNWTAMTVFAVADKLMVAAALILLVELHRAEAWLAIIIIGREITISALREWMAQLGQTKSIAVAFIGKVKTVAQMTAIIALLLWEPVLPGISTPFVGTIALWIAVVLTLWSMFHYLKLAAPHVAGALSDKPGADD